MRLPGGTFLHNIKMDGISIRSQMAISQCTDPLLPKDLANRGPIIKMLLQRRWRRVSFIVHMLQLVNFTIFITSIALIIYSAVRPFIPDVVLFILS